MKKKLVIILSIILTMFLIALTIYRFVLYKEEEKQHYFTWIIAKDDHKNATQNNMLDKDMYKDNIISENLLSIEYNFFHENQSITGLVYIGSDKYLYITDINEELTYRVSTIKFKTMYAKEYTYTGGIYIFLISENNKLYFMELTENDVTKAVVKEAYTSLDLDIMNFVDLDFQNDIYKTGNTLLILSSDGNIYDVTSGIRYNENTKILYDNIYVFDDNSMATLYGKVYKDINGMIYKLKNIFLTYDDNDFTGQGTILLITEDDKLLYLDSEFYRIYEFNVKVKDVKFNLNYPYLMGELNITFEDGYTVNFDASCNEHYCINELE